MFQNISADRLETLLDQGRAFTLSCLGVILRPNRAISLLL